MPPEQMPLASKRRALELGAGFIERDLAELRAGGRRSDETGQPHSHGFEHDVMKAAEWASAATWLRALAEQEEP